LGFIRRGCEGKISGFGSFDLSEMAGLIKTKEDGKC